MHRLTVSVLFLVLSLNFAASAAVAQVAAPDAFSVEEDDRVMQIVTEAGYLGLLANQHWELLESKTKPPVIRLYFNLPPAGETAEDLPPGLLLRAVYKNRLDTEEARQALAGIGEDLGGDEVRPGELPVEKYEQDGWTLYAQSMVEENDRLAHYIDCERDFGELIVTGRFSWQEVRNGREDYNAAMVATLRHVLNSIMVEQGDLPKIEGIELYRPAK